MKMTSEKKCLLILGIFSLGMLCIFIPLSIVFSMWGLTIGWAIGSVSVLINNFLLFKSGKAIESSAQKNKGLGISFLFYGLRFLILLGSLIAAALLQFILKGIFNYCLYTCAASVLPSALIIVIFYKEKNTDEVKSI